MLGGGYPSIYHAFPQATHNAERWLQVNRLAPVFISKSFHRSSNSRSLEMPSDIKNVPCTARPSQKSGSPVSRALLYLVLALSAATAFPYMQSLWLHSEWRNDQLIVREMHCGPWAPWYLFPDKTRPQHTSEEVYTPPAGDAQIGILQVCSTAPKSWYLNYLIYNHRDYAVRWEYEYSMYHARVGDSYWAKVEALKSKLLHELAKTESERLRWIFYTDIDTIIINPYVKLEWMLPEDAQGMNGPMLVIANDHNGLNNGVFFLRVDERSLQWVNSVSMHPRTGKKHLEMHEQTIMEYTLQDLKFEERGQVIFVPQTWFNSYSGSNAVDRLRDDTSATSTFQLHWPSPNFKTRAMLPLLKSFRETPQLLSREDLIKASERFKAQTAAWWAEHGRKR